MDNTCVLCVDCFKRSPHRHHKYKMGTSNGGGCCDCGDTEAWKSEPFCDLHVVGTLPQEEPQGLPEELSARTKEVFLAALSYCYQLLTLEHSPGLPNDLRLKDNEQDPLRILDQPDSYCTVLYNDETHTFEQVIATLTRVIKCSQRDAVEYVTNIDREGRAVVKCSTFQHCNELKAEIERFTARHGNRCLKVLVVHTHVVAHQIFAMKLLQWMQTFVANAEGFRKVLSAAALFNRPKEMTVAEGVLLRDCQMWKAARAAWHRLLIAGMLMDYDTKKSLSTVFTKHYGSIMKEFINDDHDHAFSVSSLSVQIYTVPTLAHHLIAHEDALFFLLNTFLSECTRKCNKQEKLEFERNVSNTMFKRAQFILYDLKYLLSAKPEVWTPALRQGFLQGLPLILNLLTLMQGMDAVSRQVGQHMEFEPEWESAFNLHIKLATVVSLALEWCGTDKVVLVKAYRAVLSKLYNNPPATHPVVKHEVKELADHSASCINYDVSSQPVSIHLPLSRFLAGLHLHLSKFDLAFDSPELHIDQRPTLEQIIEPVLRTQAMIAQVHAGMWRRNGYALLNQLYFYHNVKCRSEMLDRDIVLLQVGASLIESNEFLIHLLNKFNLTYWAQNDFEFESLRAPEEDSMRQTINLVEEFLGLLITVISERYVPGVGECTVEERTKKEIIQQLCARPLSHSELNRTLPEDQLHETGMENVIEEVAEFKKPTAGQGRGVYSLKPHLYSEYNVFFYHYTREDLSKSEEEQIKRRKAAGELECCPPPELPKLTPSFSMLADLLQCDVMLHIMKTVLYRSVDLHARSFSEMQLHKVLHLIGMALQEQASGRYPFLVFTERCERQHTTVANLLGALQTSARVEAHKDLITWTLNKFKDVEAATKEASGNMDVSTAKAAVSESPTVTKNVADPSTATAQELDKEWRAKMAAKRRAKIMAQMQAQQNNFMKENAKLFEDTDTGSQSTSTSKSISEDSEIKAEGFSMDIASGEHGQHVALGPVAWRNRVRAALPAVPTHTCILCQEDTPVQLSGPPLVLAGFVQQSTVLLRNRNCGPPPVSDVPWLPAVLGTAPHVSTCGHVMHGLCWQKYYDNVILRENRRPYRLRQPASFNIEKQEFLCPLCECLSNTVLPLQPSLSSMLPIPSAAEIEETPIDFQDWIAGLQTVLKLKVLQSPAHQCNETCTELHCHVKLEPSAASPPPQSPVSSIYYSCHVQQVVKEMSDRGEKFAALFPTDGPSFSEEHKDLIQLFSSVTHINVDRKRSASFKRAMYTRGLGVNPHAGDPRSVMVAWSGTAYTLLSIEAQADATERPLLGQLSSRHRDCLQALIRIVGTLGSACTKQEIVSSYALELLSPLLGSPASGERPISVLEWDSLGYLLSLVMSLPGLFVDGRQTCNAPIHPVMGLHALKLVLLAHITKVMITADFSGCFLSRQMEDEEFEASHAVKLVNCDSLLVVLEKVLPNADLDGMDVRAAWDVVRNGCQSFLRASCLFFRFLTDVPAAPALEEPGGDTFENMCTYLGLPDTFDEIIDSALCTNLITGWASHQDVGRFLADRTAVAWVPREPRSPAALVTLPDDYSELINAVSLFTCPNSDREDSRNPTMCLVCGEMLCSQSYCCQTELNKNLVGACTFHAHTCGAGVGVFLRVRECEVLLLAAPSKGCVVSPPYVDQYGETDQGLRRGNPLRLCRDTYAKLRMLWLSHGIHEEIARSIESSTNLMTTTWHHL